MKLKNLFIVALCLLGFNFVSCNKNSGNDNLAGTTWWGKSLQTQVRVDFGEKDCNISVKGYCNGTAVASYVTDNNNVTVTITSLEGDFDGQLTKGEKIKAVYDLKKGKMVASKELYGQVRELELSTTPNGESADQPKPEDKPEPKDE